MNEVTMQKWEYEILTLEWNSPSWKWKDTGETSMEKPEKQRLSEMGNEAWELVNVSTYTDQLGITLKFHFYFKRPIK